MRVTLGGDRLGSGNKMKVDLHGYGRSTFDLSHAVRTTLAAGVLTPFLTQIALPGDTWDIDLDVAINTLPTVGPAYCSEKVQLDVFLIPMRLYNAALMQNLNNVGKDMKSVLLPQLELEAFAIPVGGVITDSIQINPSSLLAHLGIAGLGVPEVAANIAKRRFDAGPYLGYWDIYNTYFANKQEEIGAMIHKTLVTVASNITTVERINNGVATAIPTGSGGTFEIRPTDLIKVTNTSTKTLPEHLFFTMGPVRGAQNYQERISAADLFDGYTDESATVRVYYGLRGYNLQVIKGWGYINNRDLGVDTQVFTFPLVNINTMKERILQQPRSSALIINAATNLAPYHIPLTKNGALTSMTQNLEGLALKTYQADMNNAWMNNAWVDGTNGLNELSAVSTASGSFTMDQLNLAKKIYEVLSRIEMSGGTYEDYLETVYDHKQIRKLNSPMYMGGLSKEIMYQEVIAQSGTDNGDQPLGQLGGRGVLGKKHKGGKLHISVDEPCYLMGLISITPRVDYSQGNAWHVNLKSIDDLHKPALDQIGFQDKITDTMAWWDTRLDINGLPTFRSAGKVPAWQNYQTEVNKVRGNFAIKSNMGFMVQTRDYSGQDAARISDLTTYIDPIKSGFKFTETTRDAQNYWANIGIGAIVRRKMSAKIMPNI